MPPNTFLKQVALITALTGFIFLAALFLNLIPQKSIPDNSDWLIKNPPTYSAPEQTNINLPLRLKISKLDIDAAIIPLGLTSEGAMAVPQNPAEVAWFSLGPRPGEIGSAVLAGHYGWQNNLPAVFDNLHKLQVGDKIMLEDEKGLNTTFVVRAIKIYDKDDIATDIFSSNDEKAHLNLITCTGTWNRAAQTHSNRLVIFTDKE